MAEVGARTPTSRLIAAFAAVYIIWGSTYLAIRFAIETLPPFLMAGVRFVIAGALLYAWTVRRSGRRPERGEWKAAIIIGALLLLGGNGGVVWAEQTVPSGVAALIVAIVPCWMVLLDWARPGGSRPAAQVGLGLILGLAGVALLVGPSSLAGGMGVDTIGSIALVFASLSWAAGSIYARQTKPPAVPLQATAMQMLAGGALLIFAGVLAGETASVDLSRVSARSAAAFLYLIAFGSIVGYSAYAWLLRKSTAARVSTYAYVNPVVAVFLGWALAGEPLTPRMMLAAAVIIAGVALITLSGRPRARARPADEPEPFTAAKPSSRMPLRAVSAMGPRPARQDAASQ
ncbi:MAG: EamA family transporter [Longimicrobiales bacterium]